MKNCPQFVTFVALAGSIASLSAAEITGKIKLEGKPPAELKIDPGTTCGKDPKPLTTRHYVVSPDGGLANVFVYVKEGLTKKYDPPAAMPVIDQKNCQYEPVMMGVQVGQKFQIKNSDPFMHNVHAIPKVNKEFNRAQPMQNQVDERAFDKPEVLVQFKCDVHPWMFAYMGVVEHPFFAVTDKDGSFKIANLPAGTYTIEAIHKKAGTATSKITIADSDKKEVNFTLKVPAAP